MASIRTIQDNPIKIGGYFQITHPSDKSIDEIFEITLIEYDPSSNQNKIIGDSIDHDDYSIEIIQGKNYFYIEGFDQGYNVRFEEDINDFYDDFYGQETLATNLPEFVQKHRHEIMNWNQLSSNKGIPIEFIEETLGQEGYEWEWDYIVNNKNITPEFVKKHRHEIKKLDWLSDNQGIPIEFIEETLGQEGYEWDWSYITGNPNITPEFVQKHRHEIKHCNEINDWIWLSENPGIPIEFIDDTLYQEGYKWKWGRIEHNRNITPEFVEKHRHEIKNWKSLTFNRGIPIEFIEETLGQEGYEWDWEYITSNPNITPEFVQKHRYGINRWGWIKLSENPGIPIEFIEETLGQPGYKWAWASISGNSNITPEFVREHFHKIEDWRELSENLRIPIEFINETLYQKGYKWDWKGLSKNSGIPIEFIDETWGQTGYKWDIRAISERKEPHNKQPMIKAARS